MSENFGKSAKFPAPEPETEKQQMQRYPNHAHLANPRYSRIIKDYFLCVSKYF